MILPDPAETLDITWPDHTLSFVTRDEYDRLAARCAAAEKRRNELAATLHQIHAGLRCPAGMAWSELPPLVITLAGLPR